jgi:hypothetical protein
VSRAGEIAALVYGLGVLCWAFAAGAWGKPNVAGVGLIWPFALFAAVCLTTGLMIAALLGGLANLGLAVRRELNKGGA